MAKGSAKKPGDPKCRGSQANIEGRDWVRVGGSKWLREVAEQKGKFIPLEYRGGKRPGKKAEAEAEAETVEAEPTEVEAALAE